MSNLADQLLSNPDVARVLCVAVATEAQKLGPDTKIDSAELATKFNRLVRQLNRKTFVDECRKLERMGPDRYLRAVAASLPR